MSDLQLPCSYNIRPHLKVFEITASSYLSQRVEFIGVVGAAIIIHNNRVLLLQRAPDDDGPNLWEVPGGEASKNETLVQCAVRELKEETGLEACVVLDMVGEFEWLEKRPEIDSHGETRNWKIFMFMMAIKDSNEKLEVILDQQEHQRYLWATETDIREGSCDGTRLEWISSNQIRAILAAFEMQRAKIE